MPVYITYPTNADIMIDDVRLHIGDYEKKKFSDSLIRAAILGGIRMLQRRWKNRYVIYNDAMLTTAPSGTVVPSGYLYATVIGTASFVPSGLTADLDVVRNPAHTFTDPGPDIISQEDRYPITIAASLILRKSQITSSADSLQSWSDGEYSYSNLSSAKNLQAMYDSDFSELNLYFKRRPAPVLRGNFADNIYTTPYTVCLF